MRNHTKLKLSKKRKKKLKTFSSNGYLQHVYLCFCIVGTLGSDCWFTQKVPQAPEPLALIPSGSQAHPSDLQPLSCPPALKSGRPFPVAADPRLGHCSGWHSGKKNNNNTFRIGSWASSHSLVPVILNHAAPQD